MATLAFFTDAHISSKPRFGLPDVLWQMWWQQRVGFVLQQMIDRLADIVVFGGDMFHRPTETGTDAVREALALLSKWPATLVALGQHDLCGHTLGASIGTLMTMIHCLENVAWPEFPWICQCEGIKFSSISWCNETVKILEALSEGDIERASLMAQSPDNWYARDKTARRVSQRIGLVLASSVGMPDVLVVHGQVLPERFSVPFDVFRPRPIPGCKLVLCGDMHVPFIERSGDTIWHSTGTVLGVTASDIRNNRWPTQVSFVDTDTWEIETVQIAVDADDDVVNEVSKRVEKTSPVLPDEATQELPDVEMASLLDRVAALGYDPNVVRVLLKVASETDHFDVHSLAEVFCRLSSRIEECGEHK